MKFCNRLVSQDVQPAASTLGSTLVSVLAAVGLACTAPAFAQEAAPKKEDKFEFGGYWRMGYNTLANPLQDAGSSGADSQGFGKFGDLPTSRAGRDPNYVALILGRQFENGMKVRAKLDIDNGTVVHESNTWGDPTKNIIRVRDMYLDLPIAGTEARIWAGSRLFEYEDLRLFDVSNPFDTNGFGAGYENSGFQVYASFVKSQREQITLNAAGTEIPNANAKANTKDVSAVLRYEVALTEGMSVKPMLKFTRNGGAPQDKSDKATNTTKKEIKGSNSFIVGGVWSRWDKQGYWGNTVLAVASNPAQGKADANGAVIARESADYFRGDKSGSDTSILVQDTTNLDFGVGGILTGIYLEQQMFKEDKQVFKVTNGAVVKDADKKTKSTTKVSLAVQPVYYVADHFHTAVDVNYAFKSQKVDAGNANALLVTPILRYAMNKNPLGTPQIFTSITYGKYDSKIKKDAKGEAKDSLVTTQTGFEVWF